MPLLRARAPLPTARIIQAEIGVRRSDHPIRLSLSSKLTPKTFPPKRQFLLRRHFGHADAPQPRTRTRHRSRDTRPEPKGSAAVGRARLGHVTTRFFTIFRQQDPPAPRPPQGARARE